MSTVEERLSAFETDLQSVKRLLAEREKPRAWLNDVAGSMEPWPEFEEVLRLGKELRASHDNTSETADDGG